MRTIISCHFYIFAVFFAAVYIVELLVLQTIYVVKEILQFLCLKSVVYNCEQFQVKIGL